MNKAKSVSALIFSQVGFFWAVLFIFMAVSVTESGDFFNKAITHNVFYGVLGYAVAAVFDLLSLVFMLARLNAGRIADRRGEWLSLFGVSVCAAVSAFANMATAVQTYDVSQFNHIPAWMSQVAPYLGMVFPAMIIVVSIISDHIGDLNPQKADSIEKYRIKEQKKVDLLRVRLDIEQQLATVRLQMVHLKKPVKAPKQTVLQLEQNYQKKMAEMQAAFDLQINDLIDEIAALKMLLTPTDDRSTSEIETVDETVDGLNTETVAKTVDRTVVRKGATSALPRARRVLKAHPELRPTDLAKRLDISPSYASQLKTRVLTETAQMAATTA